MKVPCHDITDQTGYTCNRICRKPLSCSRHKCQTKCCVVSSIHVVVNDIKIIIILILFIMMMMMIIRAYKFMIWFLFENKTSFLLLFLYN